MRNLTLLTDFYELTMMNGFYQCGMEQTEAVFDLFFRTQDEGNFCISAGLEQAVEYISNLHFDDEDIEYLRSTKELSEEFLQSLKNFKFTGDIYAVPEGVVVFPNEPLIIVKAPIMQAQLVESALLNIINFQTLIATKSARVNIIAHPSSVLEFGLRRAQAPDAAIYGARAAVIGGCSSTSNVLAAQMFNLVPKGTHAHSWIMAFSSEYEAFKQYAKLYPNSCLLLVDTYDTIKSGMVNAIKVFKEMREQGLKPVGVRLDSGDLAYLSKQARAMLDEAGFTEAKIFASGDLDEYTINALKQQGARIDIFGVGTKLITSYNNPSLGGVYKLSAIFEGDKQIPKMKISDNPIKVTNPAFKKIVRLVDNTTNKAIADVLTLHNEVIDSTKPYTLTHPIDRWKSKTITNFTATDLLVKVFENGKLIYELPTVEQIKNTAQASMSQLWDEYKRLVRPHLYKVDLSDRLYEIKEKFLLSKSKGDVDGI